ncbi:hypothetical protein CYMTET_7477 [Cymbomonas tetramitiformis]|uniref:Uncharacterized protein n=1 Tax=Cymbomonas tetramitiformis TaxID=36881 RepID=A0AAE0GWX3_9CHLO|nr:hypothetical protein CYMTET_7477 [Cymbomonas tetramitiformis]
MNATGVDGSIWMGVLERRKGPFLPELCPWIPKQMPHEGALVEYCGSHIDNNDTLCLKACWETVNWSHEFTDLGYLPKQFGKVLQKAGVPRRQLQQLIKNIFQDVQILCQTKGGPL